MYSASSHLPSLTAVAVGSAGGRHRRSVAGSFDLSRAFASDASELAQARARAKIARHSDIRAAGNEVEDAVRAYLGRMLPPSYRVTKGHVIDRTGAVSPQLDVVITDARGFASLMTTSDGTEYIPFTSVYAVGEIKSTYYKSEAPLQRMHEMLKKLAAMKRPLVENTAYGAVLPDTLVSDLARPSPHRYYNNLFSFLLCVDTGDFAFDDVKQFLRVSDASHLPSMTVVLNHGVILYAQRGSAETRGYQRYPNKAEASDCYWCFVKGNHGSPEVAAAAHLSALWAALLSHLSESYLEPPSAPRYLESVSAFSRSSRRWARG